MKYIHLMPVNVYKALVHLKGKLKSITCVMARTKGRKEELLMLIRLEQ